MRPIVLLALGVSLLACGSAVSQQATNSAEPPGLEVISRIWTKIVLRPNNSSPAPASQTIVRGDTNQPLEPIDPTPKLAKTPPVREFYHYSATIINRGQKAIRSLMWNYIFSDPATHAELKKQTGFNGDKIGVNEKKTLLIRSKSSPPRVVNAGAMGGFGSGFEERISFECVEFVDGSFWEAESAKGTACEKLRSWRRGK